MDMNVGHVSGRSCVVRFVAVFSEWYNQAFHLQQLDK